MPVASKSNRLVGRPPDAELQERRRAEILDTATAVFAENGFAAADVQEIADKTGVGKGTIYRYFPSKEELFLAAVDHGMRNLKLAVDAAAAVAAATAAGAECEGDSERRGQQPTFDVDAFHHGVSPSLWS